MVALQLDSIDVPQRYQAIVTREAKTGLLQQMCSIISMNTFDASYSAAANGYHFDYTSKWTLTDATETRKKGLGSAELCHRHRHMHYAFTLPGIQPRPNRRGHYADGFIPYQSETEVSDVEIDLEGPPTKVVRNA